AGLTSRTRVRSGTNRTLTAPRPSMTTASDRIADDSRREPATRDRPTLRLAPTPGAAAAVASGASERVICPTAAGRPRIRTNEARKDSASRTKAGQNTPARTLIVPARGGD